MADEPQLKYCKYTNKQQYLHSVSNDGTYGLERCLSTIARLYSVNTSYNSQSVNLLRTRSSAPLQHCLLLPQALHMTLSVHMQCIIACLKHIAYTYMMYAYCIP
jgi:hypothetical protein